MNTLKFARVTLVNGDKALINFNEIESIKVCRYRFNRETDYVIEDDYENEFIGTKVIMKSGCVYHVDSLLDSFYKRFNLSELCI